MRITWTTPRAPRPEQGWYLAEVQDAFEVDEKGNELTTRNGDPMMKVVWRLSSGATLWDQLIWSEKARNRTTYVLHRMGVEGEEGQDIEVDPQDLLGRKAWIGVVLEEYQGKVRPKIGRMGFAIRTTEEGPGKDEELAALPAKGEQRYQSQRPAPEENEADPFGDVF